MPNIFYHSNVHRHITKYFYMHFIFGANLCVHVVPILYNKETKVERSYRTIGANTLAK